MSGELPPEERGRPGISKPALAIVVAVLALAGVALWMERARSAPVRTGAKPAVPAENLPTAVSTPGPAPAAPVPVAERQLRVRLYAEDPMAANDRFLRLLVEIPAQRVEPPVPIHYDLMFQPGMAELFLERMREIGLVEIRQESEGSPGAPTRLIVDILPRD